MSCSVEASENVLYFYRGRLNLVESCRNDLGKRVGINFPWGQTGRRRARAPLSHGGGGAGVGGAGRGVRGVSQNIL